MPGADFDPGRHVDPERPHRGDRVGDVVRSETAGQHDRAARAQVRAAAVQSAVCPVPPRFTGSCASTSSMTRSGHVRESPLASTR